jgi:imidazolonepropionase-like amidohydrolase
MPEVCEPAEPEVEDATSTSTGTVLISGATVMTAAGDIYAVGHVLIEDGLISAVGEGRLEPAPVNARVIEADGRFVTPGLIDTHSHLGVYPSPHIQAHSDGNEATAPTTPHVQAIHSVWPQDPGFMRAVAGGVTSLQVLPGSANLIGGRGVTLKLHPGALVPEEMRFPGAPDGLKMACGENPKRVYGERGGPSTRMASVATMRQTWIDALAYREEWDDYDDDVVTWCEEGALEDDEPSEPSRNLGNETLTSVLDGDILVHIHCYRADEMLVQIQVAEEFGFEIRSFHHAVEAYKIRDVLAEHNIGTSTWADWWGFKLEAFDAIPENAALVDEAGARAIIHSDSSVGIQRLNQEAAKAFYAGLDAGVDVDEDDALRWITLNPAWALGVDDRTGSLEVGKMADLVIWSTHPFSIYAQADMVFVDGVVEYDRSDPGDPWSDFEIGLWPDEVADE